tara:strand:+ start:761 stop:1378 length:618 start_codon:yes stop_codon:yes gene_type:complete
MANSKTQVTMNNGSKVNLGDMEKAAIKGVEQGSNVFERANVIKSTLQVQGIANMTSYGDGSGSTIPDTAGTSSLDSTTFGKTHLSLVNDVARLVILPTNVGASDIGKKLVINQGPSLVGSGILDISTGAGNTLAMNSWAGGIGVTKFRPIGDANNRITVTGADTNSALGAGSTLTVTVVAAGEYMTELQCVPLGTGNDAVAFSTK